MGRDEKVKALSQKLLDGVRQTFQSGHFKNYLKAISTFRNYSPRNVELIFLQNSNATYVAGYDTWKKLGRYVRRGETGISIFAPAVVVEKHEEPFLDNDGNQGLGDDGRPLAHEVKKTLLQFHIVTVFDVSQTEGAPLPALCNELQGASPCTDFQKIFDAVQSICPYKIVYEEMGENTKGYCSHTDKKIAIKSGMGDKQIIKTLIHEFAHATLHGSSEKSRQQKEIEAESIAFIVSDFFGIDTSDYSFDYVSSWGYNMEPAKLQDVLQNIQASANQIISKVETAIKNLEKTELKVPPQKLPKRLNFAAEKSKELNIEKEMIPGGKLIAE
jgi:antirestriction protein ArdC